MRLATRPIFYIFGLLCLAPCYVRAATVQGIETVISIPDAPFVIPVPILLDDEWPHYRHDVARTGVQPFASKLSNPTEVTKLSIKWSFPAAGPPAGAFKASPIVINDTVFIGSDDGRFYALDAASGALKWQYPPRASDPPLLGSDPNWSYGIQSSASYSERHDAVIFGAQDPSLGPVGSGARLFALDAKTGAEIWKSEPVATINGDTKGSPSTLGDPKQLHERFTWSSPLIFDNKVYVGIHDFGDIPIQVGKVLAVDASNGHIDRSFHFRAAGPSDSPSTVRGGGVWNALASDGTGIYFTTGNTRIPYCQWPYNTPSSCPDATEPEPSPNYGLSMIRLDKNRGNVIWSFQPVPFNLDGDPDWAAGATVMSTSCGELIASVQKDGWSYAIDAVNGGMRWQFPGTGLTSPDFLNAIHGNDDYRRPGAAWNDVFIVRTGGESLPTPGQAATGYVRLHALNACATTERHRIRWIADLENYISKGEYSISSPAVTGGIVFVGTDKGHLVVLADPTVVPATQWVCSNVLYSLLRTSITDPETVCEKARYWPVPSLLPLQDIPMPDHGSLAAMRNEPVVARGRIFVATDQGHVYMLDTQAR